MSFLIQLAFISMLNWSQDVVVDVRLSPAGSFKAQTQSLRGFAQKKGTEFYAENILVDVRTLKTGMSLRDKHLKERLEAEKFPNAKLVKASGKDGKGAATLEIKGQQINVKGTYSVEGKMLKATFPIHLPELKISAIRYMSVGVKDDISVTVKVPLQQ